MSDSQQTPEFAQKESWERALDQVKSYWREIALVGGLLLVALLLLGHVRDAREKGNVAAWNAMAASMMATGGQDSQDQALEALTKAAAANADSSAVFYAYMKEVALLGEKDDDESLAKAVEAGKRFLTKYPGQYFAPQVRLDLAKLLLRQSKFADARRELETAERAGNKYLAPEILLVRAQSLSGEGRSEEAAQQYRMLLQLASDYAPGHIIDAARVALAELDERMSAMTPTVAPAATAVEAAPVTAPAAEKAAVKADAANAGKTAKE